ncbi:MAG: NAD(P)/FAD-dependent oxidoreductase, partial [Clostridia bacterium]
GNDVSVGTSKANSGIVHAGHDAKTGSLKAKFNVAGNAMFDDLSKELDFPFRRNGSLVLCFDKAEEGNLTELFSKGVANGVRGMSIISGDEVRKIEPSVSDKVTSALLVPSGGIVSPYEMTIAYAENAADNGAEFLFESRVTEITKDNDKFVVVCSNGLKYEADYVINCAGVHADEINNMISPDKMKIVARKGDYCLLDKTSGYLCDRTLFQLPNAMGKGVLVAPTTHGNIIVGPTAKDVVDKDDVATTMEELDIAFSKASITVPLLSKRTIITQFSGLRAHLACDDFIVGESVVKGFYNVAGIESPGLTSAPAIATSVAGEVAKELKLNANCKFNGKRVGIPHFASMSNTEREKLIDADPSYGKIVCRCEVVTEGEIVSSIRRTLGAKDLDGVKRRTRAGMGRCQSGFCSPRVMEILSRELNIDMSDITKCGQESQIVIGRTK